MSDDLISRQAAIYIAFRSPFFLIRLWKNLLNTAVGAVRKCREKTD